MARKDKTVRYAMRFSRGDDMYRLRGTVKDVCVCVFGLACLFDTGRYKACELVVTTKKPRGDNYQTLHRTYSTWRWRVIGPEGDHFSPMSGAQEQLDEDFPGRKTLYLSVYS